MADTRNLSLSLYRYNPEVDAKPYMKDYEITIPAKSDPMLLTLLERLKAEQDLTDVMAAKFAVQKSRLDASKQPI